MYKHFKVRKKAVSPVIATLLMIAIAVAAGVLVYVWSMGLVGTLQGSGGEQTKEQVILEAYDASGENWNLYLRNTGAAPVTLSSCYVNGTSMGISETDVAVGGTTTLVVTPAGLTDGASVTIKLVTKTGAVFSYSAIVGSSG